MAHVGAVREGDAILDPLLAEDLLGDDALGVLALVVLVGLALGREVSGGALIDDVAHLHDSALDVVRGTEAKSRVAAALARSAGHAAYGDQRRDVHVLHLDGIEDAGPREAEDVIVGERRVMIAVGQVQVDGQVVHRRSFQVVVF